MANFLDEYYTLRCSQCGGELQSDPQDNRILQCTQCNTKFQAKVQLSPLGKFIKPMIVNKQSLPRTSETDIVVECPTCSEMISIPQEIEKFGFHRIIGGTFSYSLRYGKDFSSCTCPHCLTEFNRFDSFNHRAWRVSDLKKDKGGHLISY